MTEIWLKQCPVCLVDFIPLKDFRFFSCGHKWCSSCLKKHKDDPLCGECRQPKGKPHRIYLDLEDLVVDDDDQVALVVVDSLNAINMESSSSSSADIKELNRAVRKLRQKPNTTDPAVSKVLLEAVKGLERVAPLVDRYAESETRNKALNRQVEDLQSQNRIFRDKCKMAELNVQTGKEEIERLRLAVERQRIAKESEVTEKNELQAKIERRDKEIKLLNTKLKALSKKHRVKSTRSVEDPDASLHVEPSKTERERRMHQAEDNTTKRTSDVDSPCPLKKVRT